MQLSIPVQEVNIDNVYFVDKKNNMVVADGDFSKILYSSPDFVMNGLSIMCDFSNKGLVGGGSAIASPTGFIPKKTIAANPHIHTTRIIERLCSIESDILTQYIRDFAPKKTASMCIRTYILRAQLENYSRYILKISGIWETKTNVGITVRIVPII